jgi:XTP/dITP diphosphohydrolase
VKLVLATSNPHKVREVSEILGAYGIEVTCLDDLGRSFVEPVEDGLTFEANARLKALSYAEQTGLVCLAEDSGLEVDALNGAPGVHSARYAGEGETREQRDNANNARLLREMADVPVARRAARFVCTLCIAEPGGRIIAEARGVYSGRIGFEPRGSNGFGYDPLLYLEDVQRTSAELASEEKHRRSHRGAALRELLTVLVGLPEATGLRRAVSGSEQ